MRSTCAQHNDSTQRELERGVADLNAGSPEKALAAFNNVLCTQPENGLAHYNAGVALHTQQDLDRAISHYRHAINLLPGFVRAYHNLAQAYTDQKDVQRSIAAYRHALHHDPNDFKSSYNLSILLQKTGHHQAAVNACQDAIAAKPDFAEAFSNLGLMYGQQTRFEEALVCLEQALIIDPDLKEAYYNTGVVLQKCGDYEGGLEWYRKALASDPCYAPARWLSLLSLPMLYETPEQIAACRSRFTSNLDQLTHTSLLSTKAQKQFALEGIKTTTNFYLQYQGGNDLDLQKKYGEFVHRIMAANYPQWSRSHSMPPVESDHKIRIGYVSTYMCRHTVGTFLSGWIENHDPSVFEIHCYHVGNKQDDMTIHFKRLSHRFHHFPVDVESAARQIKSDRLHLLVYSDIGMEPTTLQLAALRLAPVQCKGWGHPVTTGLPTIDYYLSSDLMEPENADQHYSEKLVRLPNLALCYRRPMLPKEPKARAQLSLSSDDFIYLTTQSIFKYLPQHDDLFPEIARQVNNARFVFIHNPSPSATERFRQRLKTAFSRFGLDADRFCRFSQRLNFEDFLSLNATADVLLDTLEWSGGKTTLEALSCGLPVVTCPGRFMRGRHAYAMLKRIGLPETIGRTKAAYCRIAIRLAHDPHFYSEVKRKLLAGRRYLYDDQIFVEALEDFYREAIGNFQTDTIKRAYIKGCQPSDATFHFNRSEDER